MQRVMDAVGGWLAPLERKYMLVTWAFLIMTVLSMVIAVACTLSGVVAIVSVTGWHVAPVALVSCMIVLNGYGKYMSSHIDMVLELINGWLAEW